MYVRNISRIAVLMIVVLAMLMTGSVIFAQEVTADVTPIVIPVIEGEAPPVVVIQPPANNDYIAVGVALFGILSLVIAITRGGNGAESIRQIQANREAMERYERLYTESNATVRAVFDAAVGILNSIAILTPTELDDALAELGKDVQVPGVASTQSDEGVGNG